MRAVLRAVLRVMKPKLLATFAGIVGFNIIIVRYLFNWIFYTAEQERPAQTPASTRPGSVSSWCSCVWF